MHVRACRSQGHICNLLFSQLSHSTALLSLPHTSPLFLIFHQVAADFQVFRFVQQLAACGCQSRCPQGRDGGGCQQSGNLQGTPSLLLSTRTDGRALGEFLCAHWSCVKTWVVSLCWANWSHACLLASPKNSDGSWELGLCQWHSQGGSGGCPCRVGKEEKTLVSAWSFYKPPASQLIVSRLHRTIKNLDNMWALTHCWY